MVRFNVIRLNKKANRLEQRAAQLTLRAEKLLATGERGVNNDRVEELRSMDHLATTRLPTIIFSAIHKQSPNFLTQTNDRFFFDLMNSQSKKTVELMLGEVKKLIDGKRLLNYRDPFPFAPKTLFQIAFRKRDALLMAEMVEAGIEIHSNSEMRLTPFTMAVLTTKELALAFIKRGVDVNEKNEDGETSLCYASIVYKESKESSLTQLYSTIQLLFKSGAHPSSEL